MTRRAEKLLKKEQESFGERRGKNQSVQRHQSENPGRASRRDARGMELAMITVVYPAAFVASAASYFRRFAASAGRSLSAVILARATRRALNGLPDDLLRDVGLTRGEIAFVADAVACGGGNRA